MADIPPGHRSAGVAVLVVSVGSRYESDIVPTLHQLMEEKLVLANLRNGDTVMFTNVQRFVEAKPVIVLSPAVGIKTVE